MVEPRVLVLRAAGINCDRETAFAFEQQGARTERVHINQLIESPALLDGFGAFAIPGGFSYGDDIGAGKVLALEIAHTLRDAVDRFVGRGGLVLGICNGFQVLVKTGLLPGMSRDEKARTATLTWNGSHRYEDRWVHLAVTPGPCVFAPDNRETLHLPVAHGEGRFLVPDTDTLASLQNDHQVTFRYVSAQGGDPAYPENPNGSAGHIAGICDRTGQILGLMPHPERALFPWQHPSWTREPRREEGDGASIFRAAVRAMR